MFGLKKLIEPTRADFLTEGQFTQGFNSYSEYNYLGSRPDRMIKKLHFNKALYLVLRDGNDQTVIDFGCADGYFLPSLSTYFHEVFGIDQSPSFVLTANELIRRLELKNVHVFCNAVDSEFAQTKIKLDQKADTLFAMEVMEHVGTNEDMYVSKAMFIENLFNYVKPSGRIIVSVPVMIGVPFLFQRLAMKILGLNTEKLSLSQLFKSVVFKNTDDLEKNWAGGHLGFNHMKFEIELAKRYNVESHSVFFSKLYEITPLKKARSTN